MRSGARTLPSTPEASADLDQALGHYRQALLLRPACDERVAEALREIAAAAVGVILVVGYPAMRGGNRYNVAGVLRDGEKRERGAGGQQRARQLGCGRPLYYALTTAQRLAGLEPSADLLAGVQSYAPLAAVAGLMHWLIEQALAPARLGMLQTTLANQLLFIRSHWVRMPPGMLVRHLWHKTFKPKTQSTHDAEMPG